MTKTTAQMQKTYEKLSSGYAINRGADDAAGLAISEKMRGQISGLAQASENILDGISLVQVADSGLGQISNPNLIRMRELAVQAANDTLTNEDRALIQTEVEQIKLGINDIANNTEFNTIPLLNQLGGVGSSGSVSGETIIANKYIVALNVRGDGSFDLRTNEGYPDTVNDNNQPLIYGGGGWSTRPSILTKDTQGNIQQIFLKGGSQSISTKKVGEEFHTTYVLPNDIEVKQIVRLKEAKFEFKYEITNKGTSNFDVGLQFHMDTQLGGDDSAPFTVGNADVLNGKVYQGASVPNKFGVYNNQGNPDIKAEGILTGADIITAPDKLMIGFYDSVANNNFAGGGSIGDSGYAVIWNPSTLAPGATKTVNTLYGLGIPPTSTGQTWTNDTIEDKNIILQVGPNEGHQFKVKLTDARTSTLGIDAVDMTTREGAEQAIALIDSASQYVSTERSKFGSYMNALDHIANNVGIYKETLSAAESGLRDADIAEQMMNLTKDQVILQSAQSMMAQVNQMSQGILQLLK